MVLEQQDDNPAEQLGKEGIEMSNIYSDVH